MTPSALLLAAILPLVCGACVMDSAREAADRGPVGPRLADAMLRAGDPGAALQVADGMLQVAPGDADALRRRGLALRALGRAGEAVPDLERAAQAHPDDLELRVALAGAQADGGQAASAEASWRRVLAQAPADRRGRMGLAIALDLQDRHAEAQAIYRALQVERPDDLVLAADLGLSLALSGRTEEAVTLLRRPGVAEQGPRARHDLAVALALSGDEPGARAVLGADMAPHAVDDALVGLHGFANR